jgi:hypothetical protein
MDDITKNEFDHPKFDANASILVLMPHKFGANTSNWVLMPKKNQWWRPLQFYFFLNHVLRKTGRTSEEPTGRTLSIFLYVTYVRASISSSFIFNISLKF